MHILMGPEQTGGGGVPISGGVGALGKLKKSGGGGEGGDFDKKKKKKRAICKRDQILTNDLPDFTIFTIHRKN